MQNVRTCHEINATNRPPQSAWQSAHCFLSIHGGDIETALSWTHSSPSTDITVQDYLTEIHSEVQEKRNGKKLSFIT